MAQLDKVFRCDECQRVVAELVDGHLVLTVRHDKSEHRTVIRLTEPAEKCNNQEQPVTT